MSVLLTVNIVSHNPAQAVLIIFPLNLQTITITRMLSSGGHSESPNLWQEVSRESLLHDMPCHMHDVLYGLLDS